MPAFNHLRFASPHNFQVMWIDERSLTTTDVHSIPRELILKDLPLGLTDVADHEPQVVHFDVAFAAVAFLVNVAMTIACEMNDGFADRLGWNGASVQRHAAQELLLTLNNKHAPILFRGGDRRFLPCRAAANDDQIVSHKNVSFA